MTRHVISVQVENKAGVLSRVAGLFSARGYNIDSLTVSHTCQEDISVMTIVVQGDEHITEQVKKQLNKLIDVIKVSDHTNARAIEREFMLVRVSAKPAQRPEIAAIGDVFKASTAEISQKSVTLSVKAEPDKIDDLIELLRPYGIKELMRTGRISMLREGESGTN
ncbi:MAG: acetolactate synthase small subunit [Spirochaetia bacterium]|jgi:acetolactate synthase-1/3 small subunit|nr:acetolactate synthase small subunit [Spirochaetia bacterium]